MIKQGIQVKDSNVLVLGITFKENCPDIRNSKVVDVIRALKEYDTNVTIYDPWANPEEVKREYGLTCHSELVSEFHSHQYSAIVFGVAHKEFLNLDLDALKTENAVVYDFKGRSEERL
jgi:UDP-N-acetyl-D-galactosamine dehydrogenase